MSSDAHEAVKLVDQATRSWNETADFRTIQKIIHFINTHEPPVYLLFALQTFDL